MISRVASHCFWLHRYVERAENTARLLEVNRAFLADVDLPDGERWRPILIVTGAEPAFRDSRSAADIDDAEAVQDFLVWDESNPLSLWSSIYWARENARTVREVISLETWEVTNAFWHWLRGGAGRRLYAQDRDRFYKRFKEFGALFLGVCANTVLHEEPFEFMRLGDLLERAGQTARIVDVRYERAHGVPGGVEMPVVAAEWMALLRSVSGIEPFLKRSRGMPDAASVARFVLLDEAFPRSVLFCLVRAQTVLNRIHERAGGRVGDRSQALLDDLVASLRGRTVEHLMEAGIHETLTRIVVGIAEVCDALNSDYFDPIIDAAALDAAAAGFSSQSQQQSQQAGS